MAHRGWVGVDFDVDNGVDDSLGLNTAMLDGDVGEGVEDAEAWW